jgi:hypothetical protein
MAQVQPPSPPPPATPGAADAPEAQETSLLALLDHASDALAADMEADEADRPPEETDDEAPPDEEEPPKDEEDEDRPAERLYTVRPDGKPEQVTLDEALKGYTRTATFHRRMQEVADQRKAFEGERSGELARLQEVRGQYAQRLQALEQALTEEEPDWEAIRRDEPDRYPQLWADWQRRDRRRQQLAQERERVGEQEQEDAARRQQAVLAEEQRKLIEYLPDLGDRTKAPALKARLVAGAEEYGYRPEEVESVWDHRALRLLHDAVAYRDLLAKKAALTKPPKETATLRPGAQPPTPKRRASTVGAAYDRLKTTHSKQDAVEVFLGMLDDEDRATKGRR